MKAVDHLIFPINDIAECVTGISINEDHQIFSSIQTGCSKRTNKIYTDLRKRLVSCRSYIDWGRDVRNLVVGDGAIRARAILLRDLRHTVHGSCCSTKVVDISVCPTTVQQ